MARGAVRCVKGGKGLEGKSISITGTQHGLRVNMWQVWKDGEIFT